MAVIYTQGTEIARLDPVELGERLAAVLRTAMPWLVTLSEDEASVPEKEGKWSGGNDGHIAITVREHKYRLRVAEEKVPSRSM